MVGVRIISPAALRAFVWNCQTTDLTEHSDAKILGILAEILLFIEYVEKELKTSKHFLLRLVLV